MCDAFCYSLSRHSQRILLHRWVHYYLEPSDLPCDTIVLLSSQDTVAASQRVYEYLTAWCQWEGRDIDRSDESFGAPPRGLHSLYSPRARLTVRLFSGWFHGTVIVWPSARQIMVDSVLQLVRDAPVHEKSTYPSDSYCKRI